MIVKKTWNEFREAGLLWWINMILHTFGWAIVVNLDNNNEVIEAYPARVKFRGFAEQNNVEGYTAVSEYMKSNASVLVDECKE